MPKRPFQLTHEVGVLLWDHRPQLGLVVTTVFDREDEVDPVGAALALHIESGQLAVEVGRVERRGAEHTEPASARDSGDDVAAVAERDDGVLDPEKAAQLGAHDGGPFLQRSDHAVIRPRPGGKVARE